MVREMIASAGIVTIDGDSVGHFVISSQGPAFQEVAARWPRLVRDGEVDRSALASVVFNDPTELTVLESITHPHIFDTIAAQVKEVDGTVVVEIPLLGHGLGDEWGRMVADSRDEIRLRRAIARGMSEEDAIARMSRQPSRHEWLAAADVVIPNHGSEDELHSTVVALIPKL